MVKERRDVRKSKNAIKNAFIQLIINQDIRKITVNDILTLADVSRGTFYAHFLDIYDVQEQVENDLMDRCMQVIGENSIDDVIDDPYPPILKCIQFLMEHAETIRSLSQGNQNGAFITKYRCLYCWRSCGGWVGKDYTGYSFKCRGDCPDHQPVYFARCKRND